MYSCSMGLSESHDQSPQSMRQKRGSNILPVVYERFLSSCTLVMGKMTTYMRGWSECMPHCCYLASAVICSDGACGKTSGFNECKLIATLPAPEKELPGQKPWELCDSG